MRNLSSVFLAILFVVSILLLQPVTLRARPTAYGLPPTSSSLPLSIPSPVEFREDPQRGLQIKTWVNDVGPFVFVIDTGAGITLISRLAAGRAGVIGTGRRIEVQGAGGTTPTTVETATLRSLAIGGIDNPLPNRGRIAVTNSLPSGVDGILDPTEAMFPFGYVLDFPKRSFGAFDPAVDSLRGRPMPVDGAIVRWEADPQGRRPFVRVNDRFPALVDSGARFGLAVPPGVADSLGMSPATRGQTSVANDVTGARLAVSRVSPASVRIEDFQLNRVPTDLLENASPDTPVLLGRDALRPFRISFDPRSRLIEFVPVGSTGR